MLCNKYVCHNKSYINTFSVLYIWKVWAPSSDTQVCRNISSTVQYTAAIMHADLYLD